VIPLRSVWNKLFNGIIFIISDTYIISQISGQSWDMENEGASSYETEGLCHWYVAQGLTSGIMVLILY
jgi:hypothetical protein